MTNNKSVKRIIIEEITSNPYSNVMLDIADYISDTAMELAKKYAHEIYANGKINVFKFVEQEYFKNTGINPEHV